MSASDEIYDTASPASSRICVPRGGARKVLSTELESEINNFQSHRIRASTLVRYKRRLSRGDRDRQRDQSIDGRLEELKRCRSKSRHLTCQHHRHHHHNNSQHCCNCPQCPNRSRYHHHHQQHQQQQDLGNKALGYPGPEASSRTYRSRSKCELKSKIGPIKSKLVECPAGGDSSLPRGSRRKSNVSRTAAGANCGSEVMDSSGKHKTKPKVDGSQKDIQTSPTGTKEPRTSSVLARLAKPSGFANTIMSLPATANSFLRSNLPASALRHAEHEASEPLSSTNTMEGIDHLKTVILGGFDKQRQKRVIGLGRLFDGSETNQYPPLLRRIRTGKESQQQPPHPGSSRPKQQNNPPANTHKTSASATAKRAPLAHHPSSSHQQRPAKVAAKALNPSAGFSATQPGQTHAKSTDFRGTIPGHQNMTSFITDQKVGGAVTVQQIPVAPTEDFIAAGTMGSAKVGPVKPGSKEPPAVAAGPHMLKPKVSEMSSPFYKKRAAGPIDARNYFPDTDAIAEEIRSMGPLGLKRNGKGQREFWIHDQEPPANTENPLAHLATKDDTGGVCYKDGGAPVGGAHAMIRQSHRKRASAAAATATTKSKSESQTATRSRHHSGSFPDNNDDNNNNNNSNNLSSRSATDDEGLEQQQLETGNYDNEDCLNREMREALELPTFNVNSSSSSLSIVNALLDEDKWEEVNVDEYNRETRRGENERDQGGASEISDEPIRLPSGGSRAENKEILRKMKKYPGRLIVPDTFVDVKAPVAKRLPQQVRFSLTNRDAFDYSNHRRTTDCSEKVADFDSELSEHQPEGAQGDGTTAGTWMLGDEEKRDSYEQLKLRKKLQYRRLAKEKRRQVGYSSSSADLIEVVSVGRNSDPLDDLRSSRTPAGATNKRSKSDASRLVHDCCTPRAVPHKNPPEKCEETREECSEESENQDTEKLAACGVQRKKQPRNSFHPVEPGLEDKLPKYEPALIQMVDDQVRKCLKEYELGNRKSCLSPRRRKPCQDRRREPEDSSSSQKLRCSNDFSASRTKKRDSLTKKLKRICDDA